MLNQFNDMRVNLRGSIFGFEHLNEFVIESVEDTPFAYLKSMEDPKISFLTTSPFQWYQDYTAQLDDPLKRKLQLEKPEDTLVLCIVTIKESLKSSTINLLAPLIINVNECVGSQFVLQGKTNYKTNSPLLIKGATEEEGK